MVLYEFAINRWGKPVIERHKDAGREEGIAIGRDDGRQKANREWAEWLTRKTDAENRGQPFTEPRPDETR